MKAKPQTKVSFLRSWGITSPTFRYNDLRYKNPPEKGVFWYWFSLYVRERDVDEWGTCISCGRSITVAGSQAGHFMPASDCGRDLLFDERNVNAECPKCNAFDQTHLLAYAENLDKRYGPGTAQELRDRRARHLSGEDGVIKDWRKDVYAEKVRALPSYAQSQHVAAQV
jgi:predicted RNA-binding Zn-ribbon protein involved in translation (DUF1610 family)